MNPINDKHHCCGQYIRSSADRAHHNEQHHRKAQYDRIVEHDRVSREMIQVLVDAGTPIKKAVAFVVNPKGV